MVQECIYILSFWYKMMMSVRKSLTTVTLMPHVQTFLEASPVPVTKDTVEMELFVLVCEV